MIFIETYRGRSVADQPIEIVERKDTGHPDYICDSIMEAISVALSKAYLCRRCRFGADRPWEQGNGLISMNRPMGTEAAAGKKPVSHIGKIYSGLANETAIEIYRKIEGIREVHVILLNRIGTPLDQPWMAVAQVSLQKGRRINEITGAIKDLIHKRFLDMDQFCMDLSTGRYPIC